ncbi:hypothetical protein J7K93_09950 [bacterium]|nr:hypothetical protein [bacterium]
MKIDKDLKNVILKLTSFFQEKDIRFVIIGALVPAVLIDLRQENTSSFGSRMTRDVDCTIQLDSWDEYEQIKKEMIANGFEEKNESPEHRLFFGNIPVDILPCIKNLFQNDQLIWPKSKHRMNMRGFKSVFDKIESVAIDKNTLVPFTPIPIAVFLKIQSYYDRKDSKDLEDIFYMLTHYESVETSERRFDVVGQKGLDYDSGGAFLTGQDLRDLIPSELYADINPFFELFGDPESGPILTTAVLTHQKPKEIAALVSAFKKGFEGK